MKAFLLTLAVADDLGAIAVIVLVYSEALDWWALGWAAVVAGALGVSARLRAGGNVPWIVLSVGLWLALRESGVHATLAGVVAAALLPLGTPVDQVEDRLRPIVSFVILPLFALANAGISLDGASIAAAGQSRITAGVALGLFVGKPLGIVAFAWAAVRLKIGALPAGVRMAHIAGVGLLGGIGFTVALFVTDLAFDGAGEREEATAGILAASVVAAGAGMAWLRLIAPAAERSPRA